MNKKAPKTGSLFDFHGLPNLFQGLNGQLVKKETGIRVNMRSYFPGLH